MTTTATATAIGRGGGGGALGLLAVERLELGENLARVTKRARYEILELIIEEGAHLGGVIRSQRHPAPADKGRRIRSCTFYTCQRRRYCGYTYYGYTCYGYTDYGAPAAARQPAEPR